MHRYLISCALLLAACTHSPPPARMALPPELLALPAGYAGPTPATEGALVDALISDRRALVQCKAQIGAIAALQ